MAAKGWSRWYCELCAEIVRVRGEPRRRRHDACRRWMTHLRDEDRVDRFAWLEDGDLVQEGEEEDPPSDPA
jgi:hypothetical protein